MTHDAYRRTRQTSDLQGRCPCARRALPRRSTRRSSRLGSNVSIGHVAPIREAARLLRPYGAQRKPLTGTYSPSASQTICRTDAPANNLAGNGIGMSLRTNMTGSSNSKDGEPKQPEAAASASSTAPSEPVQLDLFELRTGIGGGTQETPAPSAAR